MRDPARQIARIAAGIFAVILGWGCRSASPPVSPAPTQLDELRQRLTNQFAAKRGGRLFRQYAQVWASPGTRDERFYQLTRTIDEMPPMPGIICMELLGPPDAWKTSVDGSEMLVYFFLPKDSGIKDACFLKIGPDGDDLSIGYNKATANRYLGFQFRNRATMSVK